MYREAYTRKNKATINIMQSLDNEKMQVLQAIGCKAVDIFEAGGFLGNPLESFYRYSESEDRAISPTSVKSRYITEDVPQGLVLLESIANKVGVKVPIASAIIDIAGSALGIDFRKEGRTIEKLNAEDFIKDYAKLK
jgi:opine dehydrogenase